MRSIPTDLLRAFVTVIDLRGYTRAGEKLGRTQPAISLQMKRLQELLGVSLFAKEGGAQITEQGEIVAGYARQILALNDDMMLKLSKRDSKGRLRLGIPNDYADHFLPKLMASLARDGGDLTFDVVCDLSHNLLQGLRNGVFDIVVAMTPDGPSEGAFMTWKETLAWVCGAQSPDPAADAGGQSELRIVCYPEGCLYRRNMLTALQRDGRNFEIVYTSPSLAGLEAAVGADFGVTVLARRIIPAKLRIVEPSSHLPRLADVVVGIYVSPDRKRSSVAQSFAARFADMFVAGEAATRVG
ncbi:LysR family transcriptional regulator [Mesorhizobium sp. B2-4-19]|uniref:LysR substrate-binding domain-containing protein n=1 Tax=Mesorhizobium sp. B2-4-19 TaxID=2589930 RepID=UPI00112BB618|nr:LysR family transcriptional regulator [Mesorhizobium sp. B2-4-19]TPK54850.1 LysR family transcriptional regulator [Mesorhizobium sp. B2-4-19]